MNLSFHSITDPDGQVLDLKLNYAGEWYTYGLSPLLQSAGGDLIDRKHHLSAVGVLNGPESKVMLATLQNWISTRVDPNIDDAAFTSRRVISMSSSEGWGSPEG